MEICVSVSAMCKYNLQIRLHFFQMYFSQF